MEKRKVLESFCLLSYKVMEKKFDFQVPADCFCSRKKSKGIFQYDKQVIDFIEAAINEKLKADGILA